MQRESQNEQQEAQTEHGEMFFVSLSVGESSFYVGQLRGLFTGLFPGACCQIICSGFGGEKGKSLLSHSLFT